jgi:hypothetical protein
MEERESFYSFILFLTLHETNIINILLYYHFVLAKVVKSTGELEYDWSGLNCLPNLKSSARRCVIVYIMCSFNCKKYYYMFINL